ncbi:hypothetical protein CLV98_10986 [Dyadobacter jejuensis]|uniref:Uncharacterized protein n=1 Tax=Dyadobacter jejuensis TaxID=1082580 RepID=A0A316B344_9BACT|nr:hypothetical protein [Dyadobacter jejuensis]PWJ56977.1 hypothetical protein CLV98_10986 [Dyadobacter jejuensis]
MLKKQKAFNSNKFNKKSIVEPSEEGDLSPEMRFEALQEQLTKLDQHSKLGKWTTKTLELIRDNPHMKSAELAKKGHKEQEWLKLNIRKLKSLGLTFSHEPGYSLTELGEQYLKFLHA